MPRPHQPTKHIALITLLLLGIVPVATAGSFDIDSDGVADEIDNCVVISNALQIDTDSDGWGNACDPDYDNNGVINFLDFSVLAAGFLGSDPNLDLDGNGIVNFLDFQRFASMFLAPPGPAGYANWITPADGDWDDVSNWFPAILPPAEATVFIDQPGDITVTYPSSANNMTVAGIVTEETLHIDATILDTLTVTRDVIANAPLILDAGTLDVAGTVAINDSIALVGGTLANATITALSEPIQTSTLGLSTFSGVTLASDLEVISGTQLRVQNGITFAAVNVFLKCDTSVAYINFDGTQSATGTGAVVFDGTTSADSLCRFRPSATGSVLTVDAGITIRTGTSGGRLGEISRDLIMNGSLISDIPARGVQVYGNVMTLNGPLAATNGGEFSIDGVWSNAPGNTISVTDGDLDMQGDWSNDGTIVATNSTVQFGGVDADSWTNNGTITLVNSPLILEGTFLIADLGMYSSDSTIAVTGVLDNTGLTLDLDAISGASFSVGGSGRILGGTIAGMTALTIGPSVSNANLVGVTLATDIIVESGSQLDIEGGLELAGGDVYLNCDTNVAYINFDGSQSITGSGEVIFNGTTTADTLCRMRQSTAATVLTVDAGITVRTSTSGGRLGETSRELMMNGSVISDVAARGVQVYGSVMTLNGPLTATNGGEFLIDGVWSNASGNMISVTDGDLDMQGDWTNDGTIVATNSTVQFGGADADSWTNNGTITLVNSPQILEGTFLIADIGTYSSDSAITVTGVLDNTGLTLDLDTLGGSSFSLGGSGRILGGTIAGATALTIGPSVSNANLVGVTLATDVIVENGSQLDIESGLTLAGGDVFLKCNTNVAYLNFDGSQSITGSGEVVFNGTTTADTLCRVRPSTGSTVLTVDAGITVRTGTSGGRLGETSRELMMNGSVISDVAARGVQVHGSVMTLNGPLTATNGGEFLIDGVWSNAPGNMISVTDGDLDMQGDWTNDGTIVATNSTVQFGGADADSWTNNGTITLVNSPQILEGTFLIADLGTYSSDSVITVTGVLDNTGLTLDLDTLGGLLFRLGSSGRILGGTIAGTTALTIGPSVSDANLVGVTLATDLIVANGSQVDIENGITLAGGDVFLNCDTNVAYINFSGTQTITGTGEVVFNGTTAADTLCRLRQSTSGTILTVDADITVKTGTSGGQVGEVSRDLIMNGSVISDIAARGVRVLGNIMTLNGPLTATNGGEFLIDGVWSNTLGNMISVTDGDLDMQGAWTNNGIIVATNSTVQFGGVDADSWTNSGTVTLIDSPLDLDGSFATSDLGGLTSNDDLVVTGILDNVGLILDIDTLPGSGLTIGSSGRVNGGTITGSTAFSVGPDATVATFDGVTLETNVTVQNNSRLSIENDLVLSNANVTLAADFGTAYLNFDATQSVLGTGEIIFGGTTTGNTLNAIRPVGAATVVTLGPGITVRADTANGRLGNAPGSLVLDGALINLRPGGDVDILGTNFDLNGSITVGDDAQVVITTTNPTITASADIDIDISATGNGLVDVSNALALAGAANFTLIGGFVPLECEEFTFMNYPSFSGGFDTVSGPDLGGETFTVVEDPTLAKAVAPGAGC